MSKLYGVHSKSKKGKVSQRKKGELATLRGNAKEILKKKKFLERQFIKKVDELYNIVNQNNATNTTTNH